VNLNYSTESRWEDEVAELSFHFFSPTKRGFYVTKMGVTTQQKRFLNFQVGTRWALEKQKSSNTFNPDEKHSKSEAHCCWKKMF